MSFVPAVPIAPSVPSSIPPTSPAAVQFRDRVRVSTPGRLHLGFLDPGASLGRRFGSLGLVVDGPHTALELAFAGRPHIEAAPGLDAAEVERAAAHLAALQAHTGLSRPLHLRLLELLPPHAGLGSGTQLALAVGMAFTRLQGLPLDAAQVAALLGRGLRSGVGIAGFERGGLLLDGGPQADGRPARVTSHLDFPQHWRVLLVLDPSRRGLSGAQERQALAQLPPFPREYAAELCHRVLMQILPGAAGADFPTFAEGLNRMQALLGGYFAPAQGGLSYTSPAVDAFMRWAGRHGDTAVGQSSWGPTAFAVLPSQEAADALLRAAHAAGAVAPGLRLLTVQGRNRGADIQFLAAAPAAACA
ncbi:beta-ribofuranosylaminobenzene 5'-phosphate synthase family protein [Azohydromonas lata]|uniref:Beta-ribofuranosylaminobenzene 5'-phosphate synthase family protein n=1 Tax=Azohydromonas lata TaxID=45677 RepID=A0ABU5IGJ8_9BURK|nr:beta-ribofuranosylaminobenzene 5'-phosphate synthase family protein [Azohydromonas lata]MDZ5458249.1 beta-ribofuranosylaminobenzene 5'-phosphate synthase family protein [Azohydromonas lata]